MDRPGALARLRAIVAAFVADDLGNTGSCCVALSGGPDSLALTAATAAVPPTTALIVDHRLQPGSGEVAQRARRQPSSWVALAHRCLPSTSGRPAARRRPPAPPATPR